MDPTLIRTLIQKSQEVMKMAYCPYSKFPVGSAILCEDGSIFTGCNVENAAYTVGVCAERTAGCKAVSEGRTRFKAVAVTFNVDIDYATPCGACRQFLSEFGPDMVIITTKPDGSYKEVSMKSLLPGMFNADQLKIGSNKSV